MIHAGSVTNLLGHEVKYVDPRCYYFYFEVGDRYNVEFPNTSMVIEHWRHWFQVAAVCCCGVGMGWDLLLHMFKASCSSVFLCLALLGGTMF